MGVVDIRLKVVGSVEEAIPTAVKKRPNDASTYCGRYEYCKWDEYSTSLPWCEVRAPNFGRLFLTNTDLYAFSFFLRKHRAETV